MTDDLDLMPDADHHGAFEVQRLGGYSRRQVDEFVAGSRSKMRALEDDLSRALDEAERLRLDLSAARQGLSNKPVHEEISERVGQILKLADEEAKAQRATAQAEIVTQRDDAKKDAERLRTEAREQAERMLNAAQEQAENAIANARAEADKMRNSARQETERAINEAAKEAENTLASAKAQAKQLMDEATARATAIHDGAERRLSLLMSRHTETMRRLTEIRDVVTNLVASEAARGTLEDEVAKSVASSFAAGVSTAARPSAAATSGGDGRPPAPSPLSSRGPVRGAPAEHGKAAPDLVPAQGSQLGQRPSSQEARSGRALADGAGQHEKPSSPAPGAGPASRGPAPDSRRIPPQ